MRKEEIIYNAQNEYLSGNLDVYEFWEIFENNKASQYQPWSTLNVWAVERGKKISSSCKKCGVTEDLVIQHTWHPRKFKDIHTETLRQRAYSDYDYYGLLHDNPELSESFQDEYEEKDGCPSCGYCSAYYRKGTDDFKCSRRKCGDVFKKPAKLLKIKEERSRKIRRAAKEYTKKRYFEDATKVWCEESIRYVSLTEGDYYTACRHCAYKEDLENGLISKHQPKENESE